MSIEGVRRLGREYDRRLLRSRNDAIENATCGMGNVGQAGLLAPSSAPALLKRQPSITTTGAGTGCGSKSGGCGSKKETSPNEEPEIATVVSSCCGGGNKAGGATSASTPMKEKEFDMTPSAELGRGNGGAFAHFGGGGGNIIKEGSGFAQMHCRPPVPKLPTWTQQVVRSFIYGSQFSAAFLV